MQDPLKPPTGLRAPGRRLWLSVADRYVLTAGELEMLGQACRTCDELDRLEKAVRSLPELTVQGSMGQPKPHPLLAEVRAHRLLLERLTTALNLPDEDIRRLVCVRGRGTRVRLRRGVGRIMCLTPGLLSFGLRGGAVMARHRRPPLTVVPPPELLAFDPDEWPAEQWWQSAKLWGRARMAFVKAHPGSELGSALDVLREQHRLFEERRRLEWLASGAAS